MIDQIPADCRDAIEAMSTQNPATNRAIQERVARMRDTMLPTVERILSDGILTTLQKFAALTALVREPDGMPERAGVIAAIADALDRHPTRL